MTGAAFQPGADLCRRFYAGCVRPILEGHTPGLPHAAALLDGGSEVLGFDDPLSADHQRQHRPGGRASLAAKSAGLV